MSTLEQTEAQGHAVYAVGDRVVLHISGHGWGYGCEMTREAALRLRDALTKVAAPSPSEESGE